VSGFGEHRQNLAHVVNNPIGEQEPHREVQSEPGERMVIERGEPFRQNCRGSSIARKSERNEEKPLSTV